MFGYNECDFVGHMWFDLVIIQNKIFTERDVKKAILAIQTIRSANQSEWRNEECHSLMKNKADGVLGSQN